MTLQDLGSIGEFLGAIGVIASLIYLAVQIRQNTRSVRAASFQETVRDAAAMSDTLATNAALSRIYWEGVQDYDALKPDERHRFGAYLLGVFRRMENFVYQTEHGALESDSWEGLRNLTRIILSTPGGAAWWERAQGLFSPAFRAYVDREFMPHDGPAA